YTNPLAALRPTTTSASAHTRRPYKATFAYLISASSGDTVRLKRLLLALYHPANYYLVHVDAAAPEAEHREISKFVSNHSVFARVGNVWVVGKPSLVTYRGPTMLAATLHGIAALLRLAGDWDWFVNLSAADYPLVTQDDLIDAFSELPKDMNFVQHNSHLGWKLNKRAKPILIDPGLYRAKKSQIFWVLKQRELPTAFKLYTVGWDNLPRTLLLYYTNFVSSPEFYFQTIICNSDEFKGTTVVNSDLHYISWDNPPKQHPRTLGLRDYKRMVSSNHPFARKFKQNDSVLRRIDRELLKRGPRQFAFGGWCSDGKDSLSGNKCAGLKWENFGTLRPGPGSRRLRIVLRKLISKSPQRLERRVCRW
ncbi:Core-2/I-branching beta-1,6-N-acetylglucosaminyltransferase family protein, partial [Striga asiatica]